MTPDEGRAQARELQELNAFVSLTTEEGPGDVIAVKDIIDVRGTITTGGVRLAGRMPSRYDAEAVALARTHGCVVIGKTNLHELAMGATSENAHYGPVRNPRDRRRIAGGSSGGSAVAVAAGMCDWAIGTDTAGSVRIPAALCGVVGVKPSYGTISTEGILPVSRSFDTVGPLATSVSLAARALEMLSGIRDLQPIVAAPTTFRLAIPDAWVAGLDADVEAAWRRASQGLPAISLPDRDAMTRVQTTIALVEGAGAHRRLVEEHGDHFGADVLADIRAGMVIGRSDYVSALRSKAQLTRDFAAAMADADALLLPGTACVAPYVGTPNIRHLLNRFTRPISLTGHPAITIPWPSAGLPVGIQIVGHFGGDREVIRVAAALEASWTAAE